MRRRVDDGARRIENATSESFLFKASNAIFIFFMAVCARIEESDVARLIHKRLLKREIVETLCHILKFTARS